MHQGPHELERLLVGVGRGGGGGGGGAKGFTVSGSGFSVSGAGFGFGGGGAPPSAVELRKRKREEEAIEAVMTVTMCSYAIAHQAVRLAGGDTGRAAVMVLEKEVGPQQ